MRIFVWKPKRAEMASNTWVAKLNYMRKMDGVHKWEKRWVSKGSMMVGFVYLLHARSTHTCYKHTSPNMHAHSVRTHIHKRLRIHGAHVASRGS